MDIFSDNIEGTQQQIQLCGVAKSRQLPVFVIPAPHQVREKMQRGSREIIPRWDWTPAFAGVTALEFFTWLSKLNHV